MLWASAFASKTQYEARTTSRGGEEVERHTIKAKVFPVSLIDFHIETDLFWQSTFFRGNALPSPWQTANGRLHTCLTALMFFRGQSGLRPPYAPFHLKAMESWFWVILYPEHLFLFKKQIVLPGEQSMLYFLLQTEKYVEWRIPTKDHRRISLPSKRTSMRKGANRQVLSAEMSSLGRTKKR